MLQINSLVSAANYGISNTLKSGRTNLLNPNNCTDKVSFTSNTEKEPDIIQVRVDKYFETHTLPKAEDFKDDDEACKVYAGLIKKIKRTPNCDGDLISMARKDIPELIQVLPTEAKINNYDALLDNFFEFPRTVKVHEILANVDKLSPKQFEEGIRNTIMQYRQVNGITFSEDPDDYNRILPMKSGEDNQVLLCKSYVDFLSKPKSSKYANSLTTDVKKDIARLSDEAIISQYDRLLKLSDNTFSICANNFLIERNADDLTSEQIGEGLKKLARHYEPLFTEAIDKISGTVDRLNLKNKLSEEDKKEISDILNSGFCKREHQERLDEEEKEREERERYNHYY